MKLNRIKLEHFKGVRSLEVAPEGRSFTVRGTNATGKTTLADAWHWLLFGKDSVCRTDFEIKTIGPDGGHEHGLDHAVEADLDLGGGKRLTLRRAYREVWTKRRGEADRRLTGHTTDYWIDGVPRQKQEYDAAVAEIAPEEAFRLLTDPVQFAERLHWQARRELLLEVCGDVSDGDVVASDPKLADLEAVLARRSLDDHRKVVAARRREINDQIERLPVRIDEVRRGLPELPEPDEDALRARLTAARAERSEAEAARQRIESGGEVAERTKRLREVEAEIASARGRAGEEREGRLEELRRAASAAETELDTARREVEAERRAVERASQDVSAARGEQSSCSERRADIQAETFEHDEPDTCAACGQALPAERVEAARERALEAFNRDRAERLRSIDDRIRGAEQRAEEARHAIDRANAALEAAEARRDAAEVARDAAREQLEAARGADPPPPPPELESEREALEQAIEQLRAESGDALAAAAAKITAADERIAALESDLALHAQHARATEREKELRAEERRLAAEYEDLERQLWLCDRFVRTKVRLLEGKINEQFELARFRLFEIQVNGALRERCEVTVDGVPYSAGLNHGARIAVGMDIIRTLQGHYGFRPPLWVDQAESFAELPEMPCQVARLVVAPGEPELVVEIDDNGREED